jgi:hypothetical protein
VIERHRPTSSSRRARRTLRRSRARRIRGPKQRRRLQCATSRS